MEFYIGKDVISYAHSETRNKNSNQNQSYTLPIMSLTLETSLICILLSASRDVHFDKRMICFLSGLF